MRSAIAVIMLLCFLIPVGLPGDQQERWITLRVESSLPDFFSPGTISCVDQIFVDCPYPWQLVVNSNVSVTLRIQDGFMCVDYILFEIPEKIETIYTLVAIP